MQYTPLPRTFYARDTHVVAQDLLGKLLVRTYRNQIITARIGDTSFKMRNCVFLIDLFA